MRKFLEIKSMEQNQDKEIYAVVVCTKNQTLHIKHAKRYLQAIIQ